MPVTKVAPESAAKDPEKAGGPRLDTTIVKGFSVLSALAESDAPLSIASLSTKLGLGKSNVHRLLSTMIELGYVRKDAETRLYAPTLKLWEIGSLVAERSLLRRAARPVVRDLYDALNETVYLSILKGADVLYLDLIAAPNGAGSRPAPGQRVPAIFPASGHVMLAYQVHPEAIVDQSLASSAQAGAVEKDDLLAEFRKIREDGYAMTESGWTSGVRSIAVPVRIGNAIPIAALGVGVLAEAYSSKQLKQLVPRLTAAAARIAETVGPGHSS